MKILLVNTFYYPNIVGGAEYSTKLLAEGLEKNGNQVSVFTVDRALSKCEEENINGIKIYRGTGGKFNTLVRFTKKGSAFIKIRNKFRILKNSKIIDELEKVVIDFQPDVIHTNNIYGISPIIWKYANQKKIPCIHTIRDYWIVNPKNVMPKNKNILLKKYQEHFEKYSDYVNIVTSPSKFTLENILKFKYFKNAESHVVFNSVDLNMEETKNYIEKRKRYGSKKIKYLFVGSLFENKGIRNLLSAFEQIKNEDISLTICGKGNLEELVKTAAQNDNRITYKGMLEKDELKKVWLENDVLIVPSIWDEPFGRVVIEGNQYGLPVIGSNKGGIAEILDNTHSGVTYQYDSVEELKKAIIQFTDRDNIKKYYDSILKNIEIYSIKKQIESYEKIYKKLEMN